MFGVMMKRFLNLFSMFGGRKLLPLMKRKFPGNPIFTLKTNDKICFLTIDDTPGDDPYHNQRILELFREYKIKATFFVISNYINEKNEGFMSDLIKDGHEIANHLVENEPGHLYAGEIFEEKLKECEKNLLKFDTKILNNKNKLFRPPFGKISREMPKILERNNYKMILGDLYSFDYHINDVNFHTKYLTKNISKGSIIVLHFPGKPKNYQTMEILKKIIPNIQKKGFKFELIGKFLMDTKN